MKHGRLIGKPRKWVGREKGRGNIPTGKYPSGWEERRVRRVNSPKKWGKYPKGGNKGREDGQVLNNYRKGDAQVSAIVVTLETVSIIRLPSVHGVNRGDQVALPTLPRCKKPPARRFPPFLRSAPSLYAWMGPETSKKAAGAASNPSRRHWAPEVSLHAWRELASLFYKLERQPIWCVFVGRPVETLLGKLGRPRAATAPAQARLSDG